MNHCLICGTHLPGIAIYCAAHIPAPEPQPDPFDQARDDRDRDHMDDMDDDDANGWEERYEPEHDEHGVRMDPE